MTTSGVNGVQRAEMPTMEMKGERQSLAREKIFGEDSGTAAANAQKNAKPRFDIDSLSEKDKKKLEEELKKTNDSLASSGKMLKFKFNEEAKSMYVEVIDSETQEVIASLPPEFLIDLSLKMKELIGMFFDERR